MIDVSVSRKRNGLGLVPAHVQTGARTGLGTAAAYLEQRITMKVLSNIPPALKPETVARKGSSKALIDTGEMFDKIDSQVTGLEAKVGVIGAPAAYAIHHEYGAPAAGIPERSLIRSTWNEEKGNVEKLIQGGVKSQL